MDKIIELLTLPLAAHDEALKTLKVSMLMAIRSGNTQAFEQQIVENSKIKVCVLGQVANTATINVVDRWDINNSNIPDNSVALVFYEGLSYPWKNFELENTIAAINSNQRINSGVILLNTPGGSVHRIDTASAAIKGSIKPIIGYITGMCASAGQWLSSPCARVFSASEMDIHGSIGTMTTLINDNKFMESMGIELTDIYATKSTKKNNDSREALKGNFEPIIEKLDALNELFHNSISKNRGIAITETDVFNGSDFLTKRAIELGLCDQIGTLEDALNYAFIEGMRYKSKQ
jgi:protease-4